MKNNNSVFTHIQMRNKTTLFCLPSDIRQNVWVRTLMKNTDSLVTIFPCSYTNLFVCLYLVYGKIKKNFFRQPTLVFTDGTQLQLPLRAFSSVVLVWNSIWFEDIFDVFVWLEFVYETCLKMLLCHLDNNDKPRCLNTIEITHSLSHTHTHSHTHRAVNFFYASVMVGYDSQVHFVAVSLSSKSLS